MQVTRRPLSPAELDHELIWLIVSVGSAACAGVWRSMGLPWPRCLFHDLTGLPCLTCGATRAAIAFFHGDFLTAWTWNPLAFAAYCGLIVFNGYALVAVLLRSRRVRVVQTTSAERNLARGFILALLAANWVYLLLHARNF
jgi:Protein of unknown function (DUF2752)